MPRPNGITAEPVTAGSPIEVSRSTISIPCCDSGSSSHMQKSMISGVPTSSAGTNGSAGICRFIATCQPGGAGVGDDPRWDGEAVWGGRFVHVAELAAALDVDDPLGDVDLDLAHPRHVEGDAVDAGHRAADDPVAAGAHRQRGAVAAG